MTSPPPPDPEWDERLRYWRRKLGRVRLGVEPVEEQLDRYRRVTWMLTAVPTILGLFFVALFTAFGRPDVGLVLVGIMLAPLVTIAWTDFLLLQARVAAYRRELERHEAGFRSRTEAPGED